MGEAIISRGGKTPIKCKTESEWESTSYIAKKNEVIIYDIDDNHSTPRFKIGDGETDVKSLSFIGVKYEGMKTVLVDRSIHSESATEATVGESIHYSGNTWALNIDLANQIMQYKDTTFMYLKYTNGIIEDEEGNYISPDIESFKISFANAEFNETEDGFVMTLEGVAESDIDEANNINVYIIIEFNDGVGGYIEISDPTATWGPDYKFPLGFDLDIVQPKLTSIKYVDVLQQLSLDGGISYEYDSIKQILTISADSTDVAGSTGKLLTDKVTMPEIPPDVEEAMLIDDKVPTVKAVVERLNHGSEGLTAKYSFTTSGWKRVLNIIRATSGIVDLGIAKVGGTKMVQTVGLEIAGHVGFGNEPLDDTSRPMIIQRFNNFYGELMNNSLMNDRYYAKITKVRIGYPKGTDGYPDDQFPNPEGFDTTDSTNPVNCYVDIYVEVGASGKNGFLCNFAGRTTQHNCEPILTETDATDTGIYGETLYFDEFVLSEKDTRYDPNGNIRVNELKSKSYKKEIEVEDTSSKAVYLDINNTDLKSMKINSSDINTTNDNSALIINFYRRFNMLNIANKVMFPDSTIGQEKSTAGITWIAHKCGAITFKGGTEGAPVVSSTTATAGGQLMLFTLTAGSTYEKGRIYVPKGKYITNIPEIRYFKQNSGKVNTWYGTSSGTIDELKTTTECVSVTPKIWDVPEDIWLYQLGFRIYSGIEFNNDIHVVPYFRPYNENEGIINFEYDPDLDEIRFTLNGKEHTIIDRNEWFSRNYYNFTANSNRIIDFVNKCVTDINGNVIEDTYDALVDFIRHAYEYEKFSSTINKYNYFSASFHNKSNIDSVSGFDITYNKFEDFINSNIIVSDTEPKNTSNDTVWLKPNSSDNAQAVDYIIERGIISGWNVTKWKSGFVEMTRMVTGLDENNGRTIAYPFELANVIPFVSVLTTVEGQSAVLDVVATDSSIEVLTSANSVSTVSIKIEGTMA